MPELQPSVIYRTGPLTSEDYDEAIEGLVAARKAFDETPGGCPVCWDSGHFADQCHHNPLLIAREYAANRDAQYWRCFHCGEVFSIEQEAAAREHFGKSEDEVARCLSAPETEGGEG